MLTFIKAHRCFGAHKRSLCKKRDSRDKAILTQVIKRGRVQGDA